MKPKPVRSRRGGRPPRQDAEKIRDVILDVATALFLGEGYGATSIEAIARQAGISKRTFYARFDDKAALFAAVVQRLIGRMRPADVAPLFAGGTLDKILQRLAKIILAAAMTPDAVALHRLMISETRRFPELAKIVDAEGSRREAVTRISALLMQFFGENKNASFAAEQFLQMVMSVPQSRALGIGAPMKAAEMDAWADSTVDLFLNGYRRAK